MVTIKKKEGPMLKAIPLEHVMAFNAVSAPAYMGQAAGLIHKRNNGEVIEVIVLARDIETLRKFYDDVHEVKLKIEKSVPVGMCHAGQLRIIPASGYSGNTGGLGIPVAQPTNKQDNESEEW